MSYNITVTCANGELTVEQSGQVPEGKHLIHGHDYAHGVTVGVVRTSSAGSTVAQVSATMQKGV